MTFYLVEHPVQGISFIRVFHNSSAAAYGKTGIRAAFQNPSAIIHRKISETAAFINVSISYIVTGITAGSHDHPAAAHSIICSHHNAPLAFIVSPDFYLFCPTDSIYNTENFSVLKPLEFTAFASMSCCWCWAACRFPSCYRHFHRRH